MAANENTVQEENKIPFMMMRPFGPYISKSGLPKEMIDDFNNRVEDIIKKSETKKEFDWSPYLVGRIKDQLRIPDDLRTKYDGYFEAVADTYIKTVLQNPEGRPFKLQTAWFNRQFANEFNPVHLHTYCTLSSVGYLQLPKKIDKEFKEEAKEKRGVRGHIEFLYGTPQDFNSHSLVIEPKVGDFYLFPKYLLHTVYPFKSSGERRSFSMNIGVQMEEH
tara:strand:- start:2608 stop:3264 length:657 start_codon:yes stop_codon:yes gene_type:complete